MMYSSEGEGRDSDLPGHFCSTVLALRRCISVLIEN